MAKVYDALQRAEEERKRLIGDDATRAAPLKVEPVGPAVVKEDHKTLWKRGCESLSRSPAVDGAAEINKRRIALLQPDSYVAEQFRALRGRVDAIAAQRPLHSIAITSAFPGEGKTTCAVNLAVVTSLSLHRKVLLIDCDLRRPKVHISLGLRPETGLAEVLTEAAPLEDSIVRVEGTNLDVLAVRGRPANPSELLGSAAMQKLDEDVARQYDRIILDTPAALGLPDAKAVSDICDGIVLVVRADVTSQTDLQAVLEIVDRRRILGMLINGVDVAKGRYGYSA